MEVVSPGTQNRERDLDVKRLEYARAGIAEYWIVDSENQAVLIFRLHEQSLEEIATLTGDDEVSSPILTGFQLKVSSIFNL